MIRQVELEMEGNMPVGNYVVGNCTDGKDLCWKQWPMTVTNQVTKEVTHNTITKKEIRQEGVKGQLVASAIAATTMFFLIFLYLYSRLAKRVNGLEEQVGVKRR
jgi:hypothetical protein